MKPFSKFSKIILPMAATTLNLFAQSVPVELPTLVVSADADYKASKSSTATKTDVPLKDIPASIQVIPAELLEDRGVTQVRQMLENVSGIQAESSYGGNGATFFNIRGFTTSNAMRDGFRNYGYIATRDVQNIERIDVLKGPAGAIYGGTGSLGGYINTVSKRPQDKEFGEASITAGSYGLFRPTLDYNTPLGDDVSFRLNSAYEHSDGFREDSGYDSYSIAPAFRWDISQQSSLTLLLEYNHLDREGFDFGVPNIENYRDLSTTRYYGLGSDYGKNDTYAATLLLEHELNENWTLRAGGHASQAHMLSTQTFPDLGSYSGGNLMPYYTYVDSDEDSADYAFQTELLGKFETGALKHNLLTGIEVARFEHKYGNTPYYSVTLDLDDPDYQSPLGPKIQNGSGEGTEDNLGLYAQDLIELTPQIKVLGSARADWFNSRVYNSNQLTGESSQFTFSPRAGIVWHPVDTTSLYFSWNKSYAPVIGHSLSNATYDAETAKQYEVGVKQEILKDKLSANLAVYDLTRDGILTADPANPQNQIQTGEQASQGIELDLTGQLAPGWKVIASYAYTEAEVKSDSYFPEGDALSNVPRHSGSLWSTYQFTEGALKGFGFGGGVYLVGEREANLPNTYKLPFYWRADTTLFYEREDWKVQLNVLNLFDYKYYTGGETGVFNYTLDPASPITAQLKVSYKF